MSPGGLAASRTPWHCALEGKGKGCVWGCQAWLILMKSEPLFGLPRIARPGLPQDFLTTHEREEKP